MAGWLNEWMGVWIGGSMDGWVRMDEENIC